MNSVSGIGNAAPNAHEAAERARLQAAVRQLEGVFVQQLFKAMRETVPAEDMMGGSAEEMFTGMLDQHLSEVMPARNQTVLHEAMLRQLAPAAAAPASTTGTGA